MKFELLSKTWHPLQDIYDITQESTGNSWCYRLLYPLGSQTSKDTTSLYQNPPYVTLLWITLESCVLLLTVVYKDCYTKLVHYHWRTVLGYSFSYGNISSDTFAWIHPTKTFPFLASLLKKHKPNSIHDAQQSAWGVLLWIASTSGTAAKIKWTKGIRHHPPLYYVLKLQELNPSCEQGLLSHLPLPLTYSVQVCFLLGVHLRQSCSIKVQSLCINTSDKMKVFFCIARNYFLGNRK